MGVPVWTAGVDWDDDGDFSDPGEAVTSRVLDQAGITVQYGREAGRTLSRSSPGQAAIALNNQSGDYSPDKATGPLFGTLGPGRKTRLQVTHNAVTYDVFRGVIGGYDLTVEVDPPTRTVALALVDAFDQLAAVDLSTGVYAGLRTDQAIAAVLDAAGWPAAARDLDAGATVVPWWWAEGVSAADAIQDLVDSEGPGALVTVDSSGNFVFRSRHHRLLDATSLTSQATFRSSGAEPRISALEYDAGWRDIVNSVQFDVAVRAGGAQEVVWSSEDTVSIADGQTVLVVAQPSDPVIGAVAPTAADWDGSGTIETFLLRTSGATVTIGLRASGGPAAVSYLQLRANPLTVAQTVRVSAEDSASIAKYGRRTWAGAAPWAGIWDASAICELLLAARAERLPTVTITLKGGNDTRLVQQLTRDLDDRLTIVNADTGLNDDFYLSRIEHTAAAGGRYLETRFFCEQVPAQPSSVMILGTGQLGTNTLGGTGLDDPATVFVLGTSQLGTGQLGT